MGDWLERTGYRPDDDTRYGYGTGGLVFYRNRLAAPDGVRQAR